MGTSRFRLTLSTKARRGLMQAPTSRRRRGDAISAGVYEHTLFDGCKMLEWEWWGALRGLNHPPGSGRTTFTVPRARADAASEGGGGRWWEQGGTRESNVVPRGLRARLCRTAFDAESTSDTRATAGRAKEICTGSSRISFLPPQSLVCRRPDPIAAVDALFLGSGGSFSIRAKQLIGETRYSAVAALSGKTQGAARKDQNKDERALGHYDTEGMARARSAARCNFE